MDFKSEKMDFLGGLRHQMFTAVVNSDSFITNKMSKSVYYECKFAFQTEALVHKLEFIGWLSSATPISLLPPTTLRSSGLPLETHQHEVNSWPQVKALFHPVRKDVICGWLWAADEGNSASKSVTQYQRGNSSPSRRFYIVRSSFDSDTLPFLCPANVLSWTW